MALRRRNGAVIRHEMLFRKASMLFRKAFTSVTLSALILRVSCPNA